MSVPVKLAGFVVALTAVFAVAYDAGQLVGPTQSEQQPAHDSTPGGEEHTP